MSMILDTDQPVLLLVFLGLVHTAGGAAGDWAQLGYLDQ